LKNAATIVKWTAIAIIAILAFIFGKSCNGGKGGLIKTDTISVRHDSTIYSVKDSFIFIPTPYKVVETKEVPVYTEGEPEYKYLPLDSFPSAIRKTLQDYIDIRYYKDSLKTKYGYVYSIDTVQYNKIKGSQLSTDLSIPVYTNTVTLQAPKKVIGYIGAEIIGNQLTPFNIVGIDVGIKGKNDKYFGVKAMLDKDGKIWYGGQFLIPIHLHK